MPLVKVKDKYQVTLPTSVREKVGLSVGDVLEAKVEKGKITLTPKLVIDRSQFPTADDEYTPAQRRAIDARLAEALEDIEKGRTYGPFDTAKEMIASMKEQLKKRSARKKTKRSR